MATTPLHDLMAKAGATFEDQDGCPIATRFTDPVAECDAARNHAAVFDASASSKVSLTGPDALAFLHNLCTGDVKNLPVGGGCEAFLTTHKARVVAHVAVSRVSWQGAEAVWLDTAPGQAERIVQHLDHFLISEQVELADRTRELAMLRVLGPASAALLAQALQTTCCELQPWHHAVCATAFGDVLVRFQRALGVLGYDCFSAPETAAALWQRLAGAGATPAGAQAHEILRVEAGFPLFGRDIDENRFAVEVDRTDAISYSKGCYLGQEPIVMARDRGQVNRILLGILAGPGEALAPGTPLYAGEVEAGQTTSSVWSPRLGQVVALAYVRRGHQKPGTELTVAAAGSARKGVVSLLPIAPV
jgi:folate-binding protein YgfZ